MTLKKLGILFGFLLCSTLNFAQQTAIYTNNLKAYYQAIELYNNKAYAAAQNRFNKIAPQFPLSSELRADCAYYAANSAIRLGQPEGDALMQDFVKRFPTSTKRNNAFIDVSEYYYNSGKYAYALKWLQRVNTNGLSHNQLEDYNFKYGYSLFATKNYEKAKPYFAKLTDSQKYGAKAKYYYGYIAYNEDDYEKADEYLSDAKDEDDSYNKNISYYLADINFKLGKFQKAIDEALPLYPNANRRDKSEIAKIIGESYFNLEKYQEAIPYLKEYKGKRGKWNNTDYYILGYSYYKQNDYNNAIASFNKIIGGNNAVAQNAYYHLAKCYLELDKKSEALNAFRNAKQMEFNKDIKQDAWLNYAKLSYEIGNPYKSVPEVLQEYINAYPKSTHNAELKNLIISAYMRSKDYKGALNYVQARKTQKEKEVYQKASFYEGLRLFGEKNYFEAAKLFDKSLSENIDANITARAQYWKAESNYRNNKFDDALRDFQAFKVSPQASSTPEYQDVNYNIAYTYFKKKDYPNAIREFQNFANSASEENKKNDSYLRLADSYFVSRNYSSAINAYNQAINIGKLENDYASFQKAVSNGFVGNESTKKRELQAFLSAFNRSKYRDDAYYVLANSFIKTSENSSAHSNFDKLISEFPRSPLVAKSYLKKGLLYNNANQKENALSAYKTIVSKYPNTPEARQAVKNARQIYVDEGRVDEYAAWVEGIDFINVTDADLDNDTYESAENQYLQDNLAKAIPAFKKYIQKFPNGLHALKANFYIAQALYTQNKKNETLPYYNYVANQEGNEFTEVALERLAQIYIANEDWSQAIPKLKRLETEAQFDQNVIYAQSNLMKAYYEQEDYNNAVTYAEKVLQSNKIDNAIRSDAKLIVARSAIKTEDFTKAKSAYKELEYIATGKLKAEALYYSAYFDFEAKQYEKSKQTVEQIVANYSAYKYWGGKSLIVLAKDYNALGDAYQATYILQSVQNNFTEYEDIVKEATEILNSIKTEQAKTNYSVNPNE